MKKLILIGICLTFVLCLFSCNRNTPDFREVSESYTTSELITTGIEYDSEIEDPQTDETLSNNVGGDICQYHNPAYHASLDWMEEYIDGGKTRIREHEAQILSDNSRVITDEKNPCPYPFSNILEYVEYYNISRETFEKAYNIELPNVYYDVDAIFGDDPHKLEAWTTLDWSEGARLCKSEEYFCDSLYKKRIIEFCCSDDVLSESFGDYLVDKDNLLLASSIKDFVSAKESVDPSERDELKYELISKAVKYPKKLSFAQIVNASGISKDEMLRIYQENIPSSNSAHRQYDLDKLYSNLDYYADLLGTEGYEYPWQVDALIIK